MKTVFTLSSGRSGTRFLCHLFRRNLRDAVCRHEPYFDWSNPTMFGRPIYDHAQGNLDEIRGLLRRKQQWIARRRCSVYVETCHSFLKSYYDLAAEFFPQMKLVHLVRHPLKTARSEANRELAIHRVRFPLRCYRADDGQKYFRWSLTGNEPIYECFEGQTLSLFQRYVVQWVEIENRAMQLLSETGTRGESGTLGDCVTLHSPDDLNDARRMEEAFGTLNLQTRHDRVTIGGHRNRTPGVRTQLGDREHREFREVIARLPDAKLSIFQREPYIRWDWAHLLSPPGRAT